MYTRKAAYANSLEVCEYHEIVSRYLSFIRDERLSVKATQRKILKNPSGSNLQVNYSGDLQSPEP
jgi:hypothetical protein